MMMTTNCLALKKKPRFWTKERVRKAVSRKETKCPRLGVKCGIRWRGVSLQRLPRYSTRNFEYLLHGNNLVSPGDWRLADPLSFFLYSLILRLLIDTRELSPCLALSAAPPAVQYVPSPWRKQPASRLLFISNNETGHHWFMNDQVGALRMYRWCE